MTDQPSVSPPVSFVWLSVAVTLPPFPGSSHTLLHPTFFRQPRSHIARGHDFWYFTFLVRTDTPPGSVLVAVLQGAHTVLISALSVSYFARSHSAPFLIAETTHHNLAMFWLILPVTWSLVCSPSELLGT